MDLSFGEDPKTVIYMLLTLDLIMCDLIKIGHDFKV
jgi:hypothetical protein